MGVTGAPVAFGPSRPRGPLRDVDGRVVLGLALLFGVLVWHAGLAPNALYAGFFAFVLASAGATRRDAGRLARWALSFAVVWGGVKLAIDLAGGTPAGAALDGVALLAARLLTLLLLGAAVSVLLTPHALGLALATLTRPVLRRRAWTASLALLLMVHFIPRALTEFQRARAALRVRRVELPRTRALVVVLEAGTRNLARVTWDQTVAVAARRLDGPEAWSAAPPLRWRDGCAGAAIAALAALAAAVL